MKHLLAAVAIATAITTLPAAQTRSTIQLPLRLIGSVISAGGIGNPTGSARVEIAIKRWSTTDERGRLTTALLKKGERALLDELQDANPVGTIRFNTELAWELRYARMIADAEGGTRVFLATDRPMSTLEILNQPRYSQYPFTLIDLRFPREGTPTGSLILAARVTADKDGRLIEVENFASQPIPIGDLKTEK